MFSKSIYGYFYFHLHLKILPTKMIHFVIFFIFHHQMMINDYSNIIDYFDFPIFSFLSFPLLFSDVPQHHLMNHIVTYLHQRRSNFMLIIFNYSMLLARLIYQVQKLLLFVFLNFQNNLLVFFPLFLHFYLMVQMPHKHRTNSKRNLRQLLGVTFQLVIQSEFYL